MTGFAEREHFIPLRVNDLVDALCAHQGPEYGNRVSHPDQAVFRRFARAVSAHVHARYLEQLRQLKDAYAPFDPDSDLKSLTEPSDVERDMALGELFRSFEYLLRKANYIRLGEAELQQITRGASDWGVDMDVCWECFDRLDVYVRGQGVGKRTRRRWYKLYRREEVPVPTFGRVVVILKQQPHRRLGPGADCRSVFLKLFKDIPTVDVEMLLPGTKVKMKPFDRLSLGGSVASSVGYVGYKLSSLSLAGLAGALWGEAGVLGWLTLYTPLALLVGYGYKTYATFQTTRQTYMLQLAQSLYYQNLDNNAGVLYRMLDEAEEQETRESLLAYFYLWRFAGDEGWTATQLDTFAELDLERTLDTAVDFEVEDALDKLVRAGVVVRAGDRYRAVPIGEALGRLDEAWDGYDVTTADESEAPEVRPLAQGVSPG